MRSQFTFDIHLVGYTRAFRCILAIRLSRCSSQWYLVSRNIYERRRGCLPYIPLRIKRIGLQAMLKDFAWLLERGKVCNESLFALLTHLCPRCSLPLAAAGLFHDVTQVPGKNVCFLCVVQIELTKHLSAQHAARPGQKGHFRKYEHP